MKKHTFKTYIFYKLSDRYFTYIHNGEEYHIDPVMMTCLIGQYILKGYTVTENQYAITVSLLLD